MSHTILNPLLPGHDVRLEPVYEAYERAYGDYDKATDPDNSTYYAGLVDAYYDVLVTLGAMEPFDASEETNPARALYLCPARPGEQGHERGIDGTCIHCTPEEKS